MGGQAADDATCNLLNEGVDAVCKEAGQFSDRCASVGQLASERGCPGDAPTHADVGEDIAAAHNVAGTRRRRAAPKSIDLCPMTSALQTFVNGATTVEVVKNRDGTIAKIVKNREMLLIRKFTGAEVNKETPFLTSHESGAARESDHLGRFFKNTHMIETLRLGGKKSEASCKAFRQLNIGLPCLFLNSDHKKLAVTSTKCLDYKQNILTGNDAESRWNPKSDGGCKAMMEKAERADYMHKIKAKLRKTLKPRKTPCKNSSAKGCVTYEVTKECWFDFGSYPHPKFKVADVVTARTNEGLKVDCAAL